MRSIIGDGAKSAKGERARPSPPDPSQSPDAGDWHALLSLHVK
jgi:hypothetical protein